MFTTTEELQVERASRNRAFFAARKEGRTIKEATAIADERGLFVLSSEGEVFFEGNGGQWTTSGGMNVFVEHNKTKYVRLPDGEIKFALD